MANYTPLYADTDSVVKDAYTKQILKNHMSREYISVIVDDKPTVIFKRNIVAVTKDGSFTDIICVNDYHFLTHEDYASVVKKIIG